MRALALLVAAGCLHADPEPAPTRARVDGTGLTASEGVTLRADPSAWSALDDDMPGLVQVWLEIDNDSGRPLVLLPEHIELVAQDGRRWEALDPALPSLFDVPVQEEILSRASGRRVIEDLRGDTLGDLAGFVYFADVDPDVCWMDLHVELVDARDDRRFGRLVVPFQVGPSDREPRLTRAGRPTAERVASCPR